MSLSIEEVPLIVCLAGNRIWYNYSTNQTSQDFIGIHYVVQRYIDTSWVTQGQEMRFEPDANGEAPIDVHSLLEWDPEKEFTWPESSSDLIHKRENLCRQYRVLIYEKYGNPLAQTDSETATSAYVLPGKIPELLFGYLNDWSSSWWGSQVTRNKFLTNSPRIKRTCASASERLFFTVHDSGDTSLKLMTKFYFADGTDQTVMIETETSVTNYTVYEVITSPDLILDSADPMKTVEKYDVWLTNQADTVISEVFTYLMDNNDYDNARYFLFANAFKMIEGARFIGDSKTTSKIDQLTLNRHLAKGFGVKDRSVLKEHVSESVYREVSAEWFSLAELNWLREIALSKEVYEILGGQAVPVEIISNSLGIEDDAANLTPFSIKYKYAHADSVPANYY